MKTVLQHKDVTFFVSIQTDNDAEQIRKALVRLANDMELGERVWSTPGVLKIKIPACKLDNWSTGLRILYRQHGGDTLLIEDMGDHKCSARFGATSVYSDERFFTNG